MLSAERSQARELLVRALILVPAVVLLGFQLMDAKGSAGRWIGITFEDISASMGLDSTAPEGPAEKGGLQAGDVIVAIGGRKIATERDYDLAAATFERGTAVVYEVRRDDQRLSFEIVPGRGIAWLPFLLNALLVLALIAMGLLSVVQRPGSLPANLLFRLFMLIALEFALPVEMIGAAALAAAIPVAYYLLNGAQFATDLHLVSLIPQRQAWLRGRRWVIHLYYVVGLGLGALATATYLFGVWELDVFPWSFADINSFLSHVGRPVWAALILLLLANSAFRHPTEAGRRQAGLVLMGSIPWSLFVFATQLLEMVGSGAPSWFYRQEVMSVVVLPLPLSIFAFLVIQTRVQNKLLMELTDLLQHAGSVEKISETISADLNLAFNTKCNYVFFREESGSDLTSTYSSGTRYRAERIPETYEILKIADREGEVLIYPADLESMLPEEERNWLLRLKANIIVPVKGSDGQLAGLLILGRKESEEHYTSHDFEILRSLAGQIALASENIGLHVQVDERDRIQREILERFEDQKIFLVKECPRCGLCFDSSCVECTEDGTKLVLTLPVERTIEDRYRLEKVLGKGGVAVVYLATDLRLSRDVAVKVLARSALDAPDALRRFKREARIAARLRDPRIVTIHDYGQTRQGCAFIVMEYIEGLTLRKLMGRREPLGAELTAAVFDQILDGLETAHRLGVVHRDLKPDNVLITEAHSAARAVKLLDFGLAKFHPDSGIENTQLTMPGFIIGTLSYMAPEQLSGEQVDVRTDLFSVGVMAFEALSGRRPFTGRSPAQVLSSILESSVELPPSSSVGDSPAAARLNEVLARCLTRDPDRRFQSVPDLRQALIPAIRACVPEN